MQRGAVFSPCGQFRYLLKRVWDESKPVLPWGLCNPSIADHDRDDPTASKVIGFTQRIDGGKYGGAVIWNPFAFISTDPKALRAAGWPIGPDNDQHILEACRMGDGAVMCGWGANLRGLERPGRVLAMLRGSGFTPMALDLTKDGMPKHPLYISYSAKPFPLLSHQPKE